MLLQSEEREMTIAEWSHAMATIMEPGPVGPWSTLLRMLFLWMIWEIPGGSLEQQIRGHLHSREQHEMSLSSVYANDMLTILLKGKGVPDGWPVPEGKVRMILAWCNCLQFMAETT